MNTSPPTPEDIGRRVRSARRSAGFTLKDLAEKLDWSISRLSNYEQGLRALKTSDAVRLGRELGVAPSWLLGIDDDALTDAERDLIAALRTADPAVRASIETLLDALKKS